MNAPLSLTSPCPARRGSSPKGFIYDSKLAQQIQSGQPALSNPSTLFQSSIQQLIYTMGSLITRRQKQPLLEVSSQVSSVRELPLERKARTTPFLPVLTHEEQELSFRSIPESKRKAIQKSTMVYYELVSKKWMIDPKIIEHLKLVNAFACIESSPALVVHLTLPQSVCLRIGRGEQEQEEKMKYNNKQKEGFVLKDYGTVYSDLFRIRFPNLQKIKILGSRKDTTDAITSLHPLVHLQAPFLQQLTADGHPITTAKFLLKCHWPFLSKLSLRDNAIIDSQSLGSVVSALTNVCHIESLDLSGLYSAQWMEVGWLLKVGFRDAEEELQLLVQDEGYRQRYQGRVLRRVDCGLINNRLRHNHIYMLRHKFNNQYFENPIVIW